MFMSTRKVSSQRLAGALALGFFAALLPRAAAAQVPLPGEVFLLSACDNCLQRNPVVAGDASGNFLAAWDGVSNVVHDIVFGRAFAGAADPLEADFSVQPSLSPPPPQFDSASAADGEGNFIVAWATISGDQSSILAQRYNAKGSPLGSPIQVASDAAASPAAPSDFAPVVAAAPGGGFVVAWINQNPQDSATTPPRVMLRRFAGSGAPTGAAVQVSTGLATGDRPALCVSSTGRAHLAWTYFNAFNPFEPSSIGVVLRRLTPANVLVGPEQIISPAVDEESSVAVSCGPVNGFTVAWETAQPPAVSGSDIVAQRFTRLARPIGAPFLVNQVVDQNQKNPALLGDGTGAFVAVWEGAPNGYNGVRGRRFAANGTPLSNEFSVYRAGQDLSLLRPAIAGIGDSGEFVVVVSAPGGVAGRTFTLPAGLAAP
jgi:large repetitive protein